MSRLQWLYGPHTGERGADVIPEGVLTYLIATKFPPDRFCADIESGVHEGWTVTYAAQKKRA